MGIVISFSHLVNSVYKKGFQHEGWKPKHNKKGFGGGKAVVGAVLTGGIGLAAGFIGSKKIVITCLRCGHRWKAGKI